MKVVSFDATSVDDQHPGALEEPAALSVSGVEDVLVVGFCIGEVRFFTHPAAAVKCIGLNEETWLGLFIEDLGDSEFTHHTLVLFGVQVTF